MINVEIDEDKLNQVIKDKSRKARVKYLSELDYVFLRKIEASEDTTAIVKEKQFYRDMPDNIVKLPFDYKMDIHMSANYEDFINKYRAALEEIYGTHGTS